MGCLHISRHTALVRPRLASALTFAASTAAHASALPPNCNGPNGALACRLSSALHILYIVAAILGFILLAVIALAVHIYRKNSADIDKKRL